MPHVGSPARGGQLGALSGLLLWVLVLLSGGHAAQAQAPDSTHVTPTDSTVTERAGSFTPPPAGLPSPEFETYNVNGNGVRYTAALTGLLTTGTVERVYFSTSHTGNFTTGPWQFPAALSYSYGRQAGAVRERELLLLATPDYRLGRWKCYALGEFETSNLRAIDRRVVAGGGVGYQLYADSLSNELALSTFLLDERTDYNTEADLQRHVVRSSTRLKARFNQKTFSFSELLFYQPALANPGGDYRLNSASVLAFKLYQHLALNLAYTFSFESVVVQSRARANGTLSVGFAYSTGK